jgi:hypothetical protein
MDAYGRSAGREHMNRYNHPAAEPLLIRATLQIQAIAKAHARLAIVLVIVSIEGRGPFERGDKACGAGAGAR